MQVFRGNNYTCVKVIGHCGNSVQGRIVCSAISTLVQSLYLGLKQVLKLPVYGIIKSGRCKLFLLHKEGQRSPEAELMLKVFTLSVRKIAKTYYCVKYNEMRG